MKNNEALNDLTAIERLTSMFLDHALMCIVAIPICIFPILIGIVTNKPWLNDVSIVLAFALYLNKDILNGRSASKRLLGQVVQDVHTGKPASEFKCAIRNLTDVFWVIEVIVVLFSPNRRIGDMIAGTKVIKAPKGEVKDMIYEAKCANKVDWILPFGIAITYIWIIILIMNRTLIF